MSVTELIAFVARVPLRKPIRHASHVRDSSDNVVIRCALDDGTIGYGEGVPRDYVTGETADGAIDLLRRSNLKGQLGDPKTWAEAVEMIGGLKLAPVPGDDRDCAANAARCAIELALLDAYGRRFGENLSSLTKMLAPGIHEPKTEVRYSGAITGARGWKANVAGWKMRLYGFRHVKVKVGIAGYDDPKRLKKIRRRLGSKIAVRVDANEAYSPGDAVRRVQELEPFGLTAFEQPLRHEDAAHLPELRRAVKVPIMLDESLCSMPDAERAIGEGLCDLFNVRLSKCGGFIRSLRLVERAKAAGLGFQIGCQIGETAILSAAGRCFAQSVAGPVAVEGSYDRHLVREALGQTDMTFGYGGKAPALVGSGLGVEIDREALIRVAQSEADLLA